MVLPKCIFFWFLMRTSCRTVVTNYNNNAMVNSCNGKLMQDRHSSFFRHLRISHNTRCWSHKFGQTFVLIHPEHHSRIRRTNDISYAIFWGRGGGTSKVHYGNAKMANVIGAILYAGQYDPTSLPRDMPNRQAGNLNSVTESKYFQKYSLRSWSLKRCTVSGTAKIEGTIVQNIKHVNWSAF